MNTNTARALPIDIHGADSAYISSTRSSSIPIEDDRRAFGKLEDSVYIIDERANERTPSNLLLKTLLNNHYLYYLEENWDGDDALPISYKTFINASHFLGLLVENDIISKVLEINPSPDGCIRFQWHIDPRHTFSVRVGPSDVIGFTGAFGEPSQFYGREQIVDNIPSHVLAFIRRIVEEAKTLTSEDI